MLDAVPVFLADAETMPALPWPYVTALCIALVGGIIALWKRDVAREQARITALEGASAKQEQNIKEITTALNSSGDALREITEEMRRGK